MPIHVKTVQRSRFVTGRRRTYRAPINSTGVRFNILLFARIQLLVPYRLCTLPLVLIKRTQLIEQVSTARTAPHEPGWVVHLHLPGLPIRYKLAAMFFGRTLLGRWINLIASTVAVLFVVDTVGGEIEGPVATLPADPLRSVVMLVHVKFQ